MNNPEDIWNYHIATGCPLMRAKALLSSMSPELRARVVLAARLPRSDRYLVDPIEANPHLAESFMHARKAAQDVVEASGSTGRGTVHLLWSEQKRILAECHGITWFSPREMHPDITFD